MAERNVLNLPDVVLSVDGAQFPCHRNLLIQYSPYFKAMFSHNFIESEKSIIEIQNVEPEAMKILLHYTQTAEIPRNVLKSQYVLSLLQASSMLQFESVQKICINMIAHEWLTIDTCLQTMVTANVLDLITLCRKAKALALWEFSRVKSTAAFFDLAIETLEEYLASDGLNSRQGEFEVFDAGLSWLQEDPENRKQHILRILHCLRFSNICASDIRTMFLYPNVAEDLQTLHTLQCVLTLKEASNQKQESSQILSDDQLINHEDECEDETTVLPVVKQKKCPKRDTEVHNCYKGLRCCGCGNFFPHLSSNKCCHVSRCCDIKQNLACHCYDKSSNADEVSSVSNVCNSQYFDERMGSENVETPIAGNTQFNSETIDIALKLLTKPSRTMPLVPCVIGHVVDKPSDKISGKSNIKPYVIYFDEKKPEHPIPFLHLAKVNEGPLEPTGYRVLNRGQELYVIGGEYLLGYGNWNNSIWKYNIWNEEWTFETSLTSPRRHHSVCFLDDDIYIIGGFGRHRVIMDTVDKYNISSKTWSRCAPLPSGMYSAACCIHQGDIYVFGIEVCFYKVKSDTWHTLRESPVPNNMSFNCAMSHEEWIYLTGPYSSELVRIAPYHVSTESSSDEDATHHLLGTFKHRPSSSCLVNDKIYGFSIDDQGQMFIEVYDITNNSFAVLWKGSDCATTDITDFSPQHCIGCFAMVMY